MDHRGEQRRLGDVELAGALAEEDVRRFADAMDRRRPALPEIDLVQVGLEDLVLVVTSLDDHRHRGFLELALERAVGSQEEVLDELLGDGAAALTHLAGSQVREQRARDAAQIDAAMHLEALVLDGEDRVDQVRRQLLELHQLALLAVHAVERADRLRLEQHRAELAAARQLPDLLDQGAVEPQHHVARRLGARRMLEGLEVDAGAARAPGVLARLEPAGSRGLAEAQTRERPAQIDELPVQARIQDGRRREDPRRNREAPAVEARAHAAVEAQEIARGDEAHDEGAAGDREPEHAQQLAPALRAARLARGARLGSGHGYTRRTRAS